MPTKDSDNGDWSEYRRLVLSELAKLHEDLRALNKEIMRVRTDLTNQIVSVRAEISQVRADLRIQQVKSGLWGALAGTIPTAAAAFYVFTR